MDRRFLESLMSKVKNPARVCVNFYDHRFYYIESMEKTNDTVGWYTINGNIVEEELDKEGYYWCYVFETAPKQEPFIYMFFGKGLSREILEAEFKEMEESKPKDRQIFFEEASFSSIDVDQYDNSLSFLEKELYRKASDVFKVYEP